MVDEVCDWKHRHHRPHCLCRWFCLVYLCAHFIIVVAIRIFPFFSLQSSTSSLSSSSPSYSPSTPSSSSSYSPLVIVSSSSPVSSSSCLTTWFNNNNKWPWYGIYALIRYEVDQSEYNNLTWQCLRSCVLWVHIATRLYV